VGKVKALALLVVGAAAGAIAGAAAALVLAMRPEVSNQDLTDDEHYAALFGAERGSW
jgi:gas vesicle protein